MTIVFSVSTSTSVPEMREIAFAIEATGALRSELMVVEGVAETLPFPL
jgi:hypothetical protein